MTSINTPLTTRVVAAVLAAGLALSGCARDERPETEEATGSTYTVTHDFGETLVPADYESVAVTSTALLDSSLAAGVLPAASPMSFEGFPAYLDVEGEDVTSLGDSFEEIDVEAIAETDPDLILLDVDGGRGVEETEYEALSRIAPTVPIRTGAHEFWNQAAAVGEALDREDEAAATAERYEQRSGVLRDLLAEVPEAQQPVSQIRIREDHVRVQMDNSNSGRVMTDAGLVFEPALEGAEMTGEIGNRYEISLEMLPEVLGDYVFVYSSDEGALEAATAQPIWQEVPAVASDTMFSVDFESWMEGEGYLSAMAIQEDIASAYGVEQEFGELVADM